ncbi:zinc knuckle CX2CX4HX4C containing protein [Tanacetum coccineum]
MDLMQKAKVKWIKEAVWNCGGSKAPGPDGFTFKFIKHYWDSIGQDFINMVKQFELDGFIPRGCNSSFIALVPKLQDPLHIKDFIPISLIGCQYKVIAKVLANRLSQVVHSVVSEVQTAYIKAPKCVINYLEKLRNFFWGGYLDCNKMTWIAWNRICSSSKNGGLGVGSLHASNLAMLGKCSKTYVVSAMRKPIEESTLGSTTGETKWNNTLPIKINIFAWRLALDRLPTRFNLDSRGVDLDLIRCVICDDAIEMTQHLFVNCTISNSLWSMVTRWWGFDDHPMDVGNLLKWADTSRMSNTSDKGTTFGDGAARVGMQLRSSPKVSTSSPLVSPSTIINVPRELYSIDVAATFGVPLTTVGDLQKLINDIDAGKHDELLSELTNEDRMETLEALGSICNSIKVDRNNADVIPCKVSYADDSINLNVDESTIPSDPIVQSVDINKSTSYAGVAGGSAKDQPNVNSNFRTLVADPVFDGVNISIPRKVVEKVSTRFEHTLYGYFIGKRMAFPVVEYYARNNWAKHGLKRIMMNSKGFFFFKFDSRAGLEAVLEGGPWLIRKSPIILKKWSMDTRLLKEELTRIPIWVKLHDVPIQVFEEDGISLIATFIGKPVMLDSYTSSMCNDSWGRSSFARCLIEVNSEADLVDVVTIGIPSLSEDDFTKETIRVEYEWRPPRCDTCKIFGHVHDYCPKKVVSPPIVATSNVVTPNAEKTNDGFQTVGKKKKRKGKSKSTNGGQFTGPSVKHNVRYEPKATTSAPKKGTTYVGYTSQSTPMLKTTGNSSKKDNLSVSNSFSALNEEDEEDVKNVYDESANFIQNTKAGGSSSFTAAAG